MSTAAHDWSELTRLTGGESVVVERVRIAATGIAVEGRFALPRLAHLGHDDQVFVAAFLGAHGSIKEMEAIFGVSYPTIKARLSRLAAALELIETDPAPARGEVLDRLEAGEIDAAEAARLIETGR
jgi:hypothetical protein